MLFEENLFFTSSSSSLSLFSSIHTSFLLAAWLVGWLVGARWWVVTCKLVVVCRHITWPEFICCSNVWFFFFYNLVSIEPCCEASERSHCRHQQHHRLFIIKDGVSIFYLFLWLIFFAILLLQFFFSLSQIFYVSQSVSFYTHKHTHELTHTHHGIDANNSGHNYDWLCDN